MPALRHHPHAARRAPRVAVPLLRPCRTVSRRLPEVRAAERTWQLLVQVSGRSGRGRDAGEVVVQTCTPDHPAIAAAARLDEPAFLEHELVQRREAGYPPFRRLVALRFSAPDAADVEAAAAMGAAAARSAAASGVEV